jgi:hypothetical protein
LITSPTDFTDPERPPPSVSTSTVPAMDDGFPLRRRADGSVVQTAPVECPNGHPLRYSNVLVSWSATERQGVIMGRCLGTGGRGVAGGAGSGGSGSGGGGENRDSTRPRSSNLRIIRSNIPRNRTGLWAAAVASETGSVTSLATQIADVRKHHDRQP